MPALPAPLSLTEPAVAEWLYESYWGSAHHAPFDYKLNGKSDWNRQARAVLALVEAKVRESLAINCGPKGEPICSFCEECVRRVMGGAS